MNEILKKRINNIPYRITRIGNGANDAYNEGARYGAEYILSHQWIRMDEALPDDNEICLFIDNHGKMQLLTMDDIRKQHEIWDAMLIGVSRDLLEESICRLDKIIAWLPIPKFELNKPE